MIQETIRVFIADLLHFHSDFASVPLVDVSFDVHQAVCKAHPPERPHVVLHVKDGSKLRVQLQKTTNHSFEALCYLAVALRAAFDDFCEDADIWSVDRKPIDPSKGWWRVGEETLRVVNKARQEKREELLVRGSTKHAFSPPGISHFHRRWEKIHVHHLSFHKENSVELKAPPVCMQLIPNVASIHDQQQGFLLIPSQNGIVYSMVGKEQSHVSSDEEDIDQMFADIHMLCSLGCGVSVMHKLGPLWAYIAAYKENIVVGYTFHGQDKLTSTVDVVFPFREVVKQEHYNLVMSTVRASKSQDSSIANLHKSRFMDC